MDQSIYQAMGKFEAKIQSLENSVERLEGAVDKLALALADTKSGWKLLLSLAALSSLVGLTIHKPIDILLSLFK